MIQREFPFQVTNTENSDWANIPVSMAVAAAKGALQ